LTTEFLVTAKGGGSCVVRVVSGFYHDGEGWEDLVEGAGEGWRMSLTILRAYLAHFAGRTASNLDVIVDLGRPATDRARASMADGAPLSANLLARLYGAPTAIAEQEHVKWQTWLVGVRRSFDQ
jgi:hypothetical protein